jgi:DNA adenine methylase
MCYKPLVLKTGTALSFVKQSSLPHTATKLLVPPLKWAGGKRWQIPRLLAYWGSEQHRTLVEPFSGGLAVTLGLMPTRALLNDINPHLINFYEWLKRGLVIKIELENDESHYYRNRERFNQLLSDGAGNTKEAASLFYYLNRTGYNGLCRFNSRGEFNVPFGKYTSIPYRYDFSAYKDVLKNWQFTNVSFDEMRLESSDFVYADPPYDVQFRNYSRGGFSWQQQEQTASWLSRHTGPVILSNQATKRIVELYKDYGFTIIELEGPRRISCTGDRSPAQEVLALRNLTPLSRQLSSRVVTPALVQLPGKLNAQTARRTEVPMGDSSANETARVWLTNNGYEDYAALIDEVIGEWKAKGSKERRDWYDVMSGGANGKPRIIAGRTFPVLAAFQERQGKPVTDNAERRDPNERAPMIQKQARWTAKKRRKRAKRGQ